VVFSTPPLPLATRLNFYARIGWRSGGVLLGGLAALFVPFVCGKPNRKNFLIGCRDGAPDGAAPLQRRRKIKRQCVAFYLIFLPEPAGAWTLRPTFAPRETGLGASAVRGTGLICSFFLLALLVCAPFRGRKAATALALQVRGACARWPSRHSDFDCGGRGGSGAGLLWRLALLHLNVEQIANRFMSMRVIMSSKSVNASFLNSTMGSFARSRGDQFPLSSGRAREDGLPLLIDKHRDDTASSQRMKVRAKLFFLFPRSAF